MSAVPAVVAVLVVGAVVTIWQTRLHGKALEARLEQYAVVASQQVRSAIAFDDRETARETLDAVAWDPEVSGVQLYRADGSLLHTNGATFKPSADATMVHESGNVVATRHVVSLEGPRGVLVVALSTSSLAALRTRIIGVSLVVALGAVLFAVLLAIRGARPLSARISEVANVATRIADGDLEVPPIATKSRDEISKTADAVNLMVVRLRELIAREQERAASERERLEVMVNERTQQLAARNEATRIILDHLNQGIMTVTLAGHIVGERSAATEKLLGSALPDGTKLSAIIEARDPRSALVFEQGFAQLADDLLPLEILLDQLPSTVELGDRILAFKYTPIFDGKPIPAKLLVTITDTTAEHERARAREAELESAALLAGMNGDRHGLRRFLEDARRQVHTIESSADITPVRAALHTLKGNCALMGLEAWAARCHAAEDVLEELAELTGELRAPIVAAWQRTEARAQALLGAGTSIEIPIADYQELVTLADDATSWPEMRVALREVVLERAAQPLQRMADHCRELAVRRGHGEVELEVDDNNVRLDPKWSGLWSALTHVARNAVTHGVRQDRTGKIALRTRRQLDTIVIEISDNGAGVDWARLREKASLAGLAHECRADLIRAMFSPAITTSAEVDEASGRGVGLSAVAATCDALGVRIELESTPDVGTTFRFFVPEPSISTFARASALTA